MSKQTKIISAIVAILIVIAIAIGLYFAFRNSKNSNQPSQIEQNPQISNESYQGFPQGNPTPAPTSQQANAKPRLRIISSQPIFDYWVSGDTISSIGISPIGKPISSSSSLANSSTTSSTTFRAASSISSSTFSLASSSASSSKNISSAQTSKPQTSKPQIFYFNKQGQILKVKNGNDEIISDRAIDYLQSIKAPKNGPMVLVKYGPINSPQLEIFNIQTKIWQLLDNILTADFSPDGTKLAYLDNLGNLKIAEAQKLAKPKTVITVNQKDFDLRWITDNKILLISKPSTNYINEIWAIDLKNKNLTLFEQSRGLLINWAKDGSYGLDFNADLKGRGGLKLMNADGSTKANFNFSTLPEKCALTLEKIYCAVPYAYTSITPPFLPDDYLKRRIYSSDYLYEIDISQNSQKEIFNDAQPILDADKLSLLDDQVLFINRYDNKLYSLEL